MLKKLPYIAKRNYNLLFPLDFAGTLCGRDDIKTGLHTPNGEDAYDRKLIVMSKKIICFENHKTDSRIKQIEVAATMGAERNSNASNDNPLVVSTSRKKKKHTFIRPRNDVFVASEVGLCLGASHNMSPLNNRIIVC